MSSSRFSLREKGSPIFSVIVPVYNKGLYVSRAIQSILNQSFEDFEIIVVCDPSTDDSNLKVESFTDYRLSVYYRTEPGAGGYAARNLGIENAKGKWIAFLDADDEWYPDHLEKMVSLSINYPNAEFMSCGWEFVTDRDSKANSFYNKYHDSCRCLSVKDYLDSCCKGLNPAHTSVVCFKNKDSIVRNLFPAETGAKRGGDVHAWLKLICFYQKMAWSNHLGSKYYLGVTGQVVKTAGHGLDLYSTEILESLVRALDSCEKKFFYRYINKRILSAVLGSKSTGKDLGDIFSVLKYRYDFRGAIKILLVWLVPVPAFSFIRKMRNSFIH